jgi:hypothetical protein
VDATRTVLPERINWAIFLVALALMAAPIAHISWRRPIAAERGESGRS